MKRIALLLMSACAALVAGEPEPYAGSSTVAHLLNRLAPSVVGVSAGGSDDAATRLADGGALLVGLSREMGADEVAAITRARGVAPQVRRLGRGAVALFVHRRNPVAGLTRAQLKEACAGTLRWSALGATGALADQAVRVVVNHGASGSTRLFVDVVLNGTAPPATVANEPVGSSVVQAAAVDEAVLAVASWHQATPAVRALALDGVALDAEAVRTGRWPLARPLLLAWIPTEPLPAPLSTLRELLDAPAAATVLDEEGVIR
jgi:phosphate transport system substrate-binding protein